jgi:acetyl esterase/lipase
VCTKDPTYDEMLMFHDKLQKEGVDVSAEVYKGYPHFFWMLPMLKKSGEFLDEWAKQVRDMVK